MYAQCIVSQALILQNIYWRGLGPLLKNIERGKFVKLFVEV